MCSIQVESWVTERAFKESPGQEPERERVGNVMHIPYVDALRQWKKGPVRKDMSRAKKRRLVFKAIVILASAILALLQVSRLVKHIYFT